MLLGGLGGTHILLASGVFAVAAGVLELESSRCARLPIKRERGSWLQIREVLASAPFRSDLVLARRACGLQK